MRCRCRNKRSKDYPHYGGRGIRIAPRWDDFSAFLLDMGECPAGMTLERLDNNAGYQPGNCEWRTRLDQARNKRNNRVEEVFGVSKCLAEWAEIVGVSRSVLTKLLDNGVKLEHLLQHWLLQHGYPLEEGGYVPGAQGFGDAR